MVKTSPSKFQFLLGFFFQHKYFYILGILCLFFTNYGLSIIPLQIEQLVDLIEAKTTTSNVFLKIIIYTFFLVCFVSIVRTLSRVFFFNTARRIEFDIKNKLLTKVTKLSRDYFLGNQTGKIISQINNDTLWIRLLCGFGSMQIINVLFSFSLIPYKMWSISPSITLYSICSLLFLFSFVYGGVLHSMKFFLKRVKALQMISSELLSQLSGLEVIRSLAVEWWAKKKFLEKNTSLYNYAIRTSFWRALFTPLLGNIENLLKCLIFFLGAQYFFQGDLTIGEITAMLSYIALLTPQLVSLGWLLNVLLQGKIGLESILSILEKPDEHQKITSQKLEDVRVELDKGITIKNLCFTYPEDKSSVLKSVSFSIKKGEKIGVLGAVGSGKTTLVRCLNKYLPTSRGKIFLGNLDICDIDYRILRQLIRTVSQDIFLFSDTVENNILFGAKNETRKFSNEEWEDIFKRSSLKEEIKIFSKGRKTLVGEKGIMLSGGQKQRISFARSIMEHCELLILDNIMSALDYETENNLLSEITSKKTLLVF